MSVFSSLYDAHLTISGHPITWREIVGNTFGLASAVGGMRRKIWAWPVGIVGNVLLLTVFLGTALGSSVGQQPLLGQAGRQVFFIITSVYGWWRWSQSAKGRTDSVALTPRWATAAERAAMLVVAAALVGVCFVLFREIGAGFPVPWWYYLADAWIFVGSMVATFAMARGWVDFWLCWLAVDLVGVPELIHFHYYPSAVLYGIYGAFVVWGFFSWRRIARTEGKAGLVDSSQGVVEALG